jgi:cell division protein FtsQ
LSKAVKRLITALLCFVIFAVVATIVLSAKERVKSIDIVSNDTLIYVSKQSLIDSLLEISQKDWFSVNIESIEREIYNKPGVDYTLIKKIWPSTLVLYIYDRKPLAYWGGNQILLDNMDVIEPDTFNYNGYLPMFISSDNLSREYMYDTYLRLNGVAKKYGDEVTIVSYEGNQFYIATSSGHKIYLGSKNTDKKLVLFYDTYKGVKDFANVEYFDMRYSNGFSVKYL